MRLISAASPPGPWPPPPQTGTPSSWKPTRNVPCGGAKSAGVALGMPGTSIGPYTTAISATIAATRSVAGGAPAGTGSKRSIGAIVAHPMPRDWTDVFLTGDGTAVPVATDPEPEQRRGFFRRLRENLSKTRQALGAEIQATLFEGD